MKINFLHITFFIAIIIFGFSFSNKKFSDPNKEKLLIEVVKYVVEKGHYNSIEIDDDISEKIFDSYIEQLDAQKRFFLQSDIRQFEKYKYKLDDQLKEYDLTFFDLVFQTSRERIDEVKDYYYDIMENGFDFSSNEIIDLDFENKSFARSKNEIKNRWRKQLKYSTLDILSLKLGDSIKIIDNETLDESMSLIKKNTEDFFDYISEMDRDDWFANYINAFLNQLDPHTVYFNPDDKDRFDTNISGKFNGIGARLQKTEGAVKIVDIIVGGPIWKDKLLDIGDIILKVAQENEDPVENEYLISQRYNLNIGRTQFYLINRNDSSMNGYNLSVTINFGEELHLIGSSELINTVEILDNEDNVLNSTTSPSVNISDPTPSGLTFMYINPNEADVINKIYYYRKINSIDDSMKGTITWISS